MNTPFKKTTTLIFLIFFTATSFLYSQEDTSFTDIPDNGSLTDAWAIFHAAKISFIEDKLPLTESESENFWPLFHEYEREKKDIMDNIMHKRHRKGPPDFDELSDEKLDSMVMLKLRKEKELINLKIKYYEKMKSVIPVKKVAQYYSLDEDFRRHLIERLKKKGRRHGNGK